MDFSKSMANTSARSWGQLDSNQILRAEPIGEIDHRQPSAPEEGIRPEEDISRTPALSPHHSWID
jgi:hypothetical protein